MYADAEHGDGSLLKTFRAVGAELRIAGFGDHHGPVIATARSVPTIAGAASPDVWMGCSTQAT